MALALAPNLSSPSRATPYASSLKLAPYSCHSQPTQANIQLSQGYEISEIRRYFPSISSFNMPRPDVDSVGDELLQNTLSRISRRDDSEGSRPLIHSVDSASSPQDIFGPFLWNISQPINALPQEVISKIAQCLLGDDDAGVQPIIPLTHVCKYWRECIVLTAANWTRITSWGGELTALCMERSNEFPLKIWFNKRRYRHPFLGLIQPHMWRIVSLNITINRFWDFLKYFPDFPQSTSNLHSLEISLLSPQGVHPHKVSFGHFPPTLKHLSLHSIPFCKPFRKIRTLTKLIIHHHDFSWPLDLLLIFLEKNNMLVHLELDIHFTNLPGPYPVIPIENQLQYLSVKSNKVEDIKDLVTAIPLRTGGDLKITSVDQDKQLEDILPDIYRVYFGALSSATYMKCYRERNTQFSGPKGSFQFISPAKFPQDFTRLSFLSFDNIWEAHFQLERSIPPDLSRFPALKTLAIGCYQGQFNTLVDSLLSVKASFLLESLMFQLFSYPEKFMRQLIKFASNQSKILSAKLDCVVFHCWGADKFPSPDLVSKLEEYVLNVKLEVPKASNSRMRWY